MFLNRARTRRKVEDDEGSIADYNRAIKLDPELAGAYNERGVLREFAGDYELALADYEQFLGLAPNESVGYLNRADALLALNRFDAALVSYEKAARSSLTSWRRTLDVHAPWGSWVAGTRQLLRWRQR